MPSRILPFASPPLVYHAASHDRQFQGRYQFICGSLRLPPNEDNDEGPGTEAWFKELAREVMTRSGGRQVGGLERIKYGDVVRGREFWLQLADRDRYRVVRLYYIQRTVYYFSVEGMNMDPQDELARVFFRSFEVMNAPR